MLQPVEEILHVDRLLELPPPGHHRGLVLGDERGPERRLVRQVDSPPEHSDERLVAPIAAAGEGEGRTGAQVGDEHVAAGAARGAPVSRPPPTLGLDADHLFRGDRVIAVGAAVPVGRDRSHGSSVGLPVPRRVFLPLDSEAAGLFRVRDHAEAHPYDPLP